MDLRASAPGFIQRASDAGGGVAVIVDRRRWHGGDSAHTRLARGSYEEVSMIECQFRIS